jgi:hypothetical protein
VKKTILLILIYFFLFIEFALARGDCDGVHMGSHTDMNGVETLFCASYDSVMKSPEWDGKSDTPPLNIAEAISIGQKWLKKENPKLDVFQIREISISRVGNSEIKDRWYYSLDFQAVVGGRTLYGSPFNAVILMDGTIVKPRILRD